MIVKCINPGNQTEEGASVTIGTLYTVIDWCYGGECGNYVKGMERFFKLAEMPEDKRFWSGLFYEIKAKEEIVQAAFNIKYPIDRFQLKSEVFAAMDEYAKQLAIEYAHWLFKRLGLWHIEGDLPESQAVNLFNVFIQKLSK